jgi:hypothetical protein
MMKNGVLQWQEDFEKSQRLGEGRSRTSAERSQLYELQIWLAGQGAMRDLIRAESLQQAILFAENRYPNCRIDIPPQTAKKPKLARSRTSPSIVARKRKKAADSK